MPILNTRIRFTITLCTLRYYKVHAFEILFLNTLHVFVMHHCQLSHFSVHCTHITLCIGIVNKQIIKIYVMHYYAIFEELQHTVQWEMINIETYHINREKR